MKPGLAELDNVVIVPHIASASMWTRSGMVRAAVTHVTHIHTDTPHRASQRSLMSGPASADVTGG